MIVPAYPEQQVEQAASAKPVPSVFFAPKRFRKSRTNAEKIAGRALNFASCALYLLKNR